MNLDELKKTLSESDIEDKLIQPKIDIVIQSLIQVNNPLRQNLPRKPGSGDGSYINQRSANPTAESVADTDDFTASSSTYGTRLKFPFKTTGARGKITRKAMAVGRSYTDIKAEEIQATLEAVREREDTLLISGDAGSNSKEYSGLRELIPSGQIIEAGANGAALTLSLMDEAIDLCFGEPNMIIMAKRSRRELNPLLQISQRFVEKMDVNGGFRVMSYNDIPIFWSKHVSVAQTQGTASNASDIFFLDTSKVWIEVLTELKMEALANKSSQYEEFDIFEDTVLVLANEKYVSRIAGVIPPA